MPVRFTNDDSQDAIVKHRRRQNAERARKYRRRRKTHKEIVTTDHQATVASPSQCVDAVEQLNHENIAQTETENRGRGPSEHATSLDNVQEEEPVIIFDDEPDVDLGSACPESYVEEHAEPSRDTRRTDLEYATEKFVQQFLVGIHGCGAQRHQESLTAHLDAEGANNHHGLAQLFPHDIPHTLDKQDFLSCSIDNETTRLSPSQWQALFSGCTGQNSDPKPKQACLHAEHTTQTPPDITYDIDSILGFVDSPAAAIHGIRFYSAPQYCQNIRTDVHLTLDRTAPNTERPRLIPYEYRQH